MACFSKIVTLPVLQSYSGSLGSMVNAVNNQGIAESSAVAINNIGEIVGECWVSQKVNYTSSSISIGAFIWTPTTGMQALGLPKAPYSNFQPCDIAVDRLWVHLEQP